LVFACRALRLDLTADKRARLMESYLHLSAFPDTAEGLKALAGRPLAILSNGSPKMLGAVVSSAGLDGVFRHVISVDAARVYKPSPRVYRLAADRLGLAPASITFVSSNAWDAQGAKSFGFRTAWLNRDANADEELPWKPDVT